MLFDKHSIPTFEGLDAEAAWAACDAFEDYTYDVAESVSQETFDYLICQVRRVRNDYYRKYENA